MATSRLSTVTVYSSRRYTLNLAGQTPVYQISQYLAQYEPYIDSSTLEIARQIQPELKLRDLDMQAGDRLVLFTHSPQQIDLPTSLKPGDKILTFTKGDVMVRSSGKTGVLVGKIDTTGEVVPDIDLSRFVRPEAMEYISRGCIWFQQNQNNKLWYASKIGQTRIVIDEYELSTDKIPVDGKHHIKLYHPAHDPQDPNIRALAELELQVQVVGSQDDLNVFQGGDKRVSVIIGTERIRQVINISDNIPMGQLITSLTRYNKLPLSTDNRLYHMRLISPDVHVDELRLTQQTTLYSTRHLQQSHTKLVLRDIHNRKISFTVTAEDRHHHNVIGCREGIEQEDQTLDVDIRRIIRKRGFDPDRIPNLSRYLARLDYQPTDNSWWVRLHEDSLMAVYLNNIRLTPTSPVQVTSGDVLSFGADTQSYYARLEVIVSSSR